MSGAHQAQTAARVLGQAEAALERAQSFAALPDGDRRALRDKIARVRGALMAEPQALAPQDPYETDIFAAPMVGPQTGYSPQAPAQPPAEPGMQAPGPGGQTSLLRTVGALPAAAGAMSEELDFAAFVASLVHGTFDAIVDSSIRQMEAFASLVASLAQTVEDFSANNVSANQVRDWLVERHPADLQLVLPSALGEQPRLTPRAGDGDAWGASPIWLEDYGLGGETLSEELIETQLIPQARLRLGEDRMRTLASMALMGMHKVRVERGEISARIRIRAKAADAARVHYAQSQDPAQQQAGWSARAGFSAPTAQAMISTAVNAQSDAAIAAELQGEVKIVFGSETVPLESFVSDAQRVLLERTAQRVNAPVSRSPDGGGQTPAQIAADQVAQADTGGAS